MPYRLGPLLLASALMGQAITFNRGAYLEPAVLCVVMGVLLLLHQLGLAFDREPRFAGDTQLVLGLLWIALFGMWWTAICDPSTIIYPHVPWELGKKLQWRLIVLLVSYLPWVCGPWKEPRVVGWARFAAFCAFVIAAGDDAIKASPAPRIDVWGIQTQAAPMLLDGENPYTGVAIQDTGPGTLGSGVPFVYPPTQIYVTLLGWALGDVRYTMLIAILVTGLAMRFMARGTELPALAKDAPALFLFLTPKLFFILEQAWIDPIQVMFVALALASAHRGKLTWAAVLFGIASSSKQSMFWLPPLAGFCLGLRPLQWLIMIVAAILPPLPFMIWNFKALKYANFDVLNGLPNRPDALTLNNWALFNLQYELPGSVGFAFAALVVALACWRLRGVMQCALAIAVTYGVFFPFNRWAFANYYFLISSLAAVAAASAFVARARSRSPVRTLAATPQRSWLI